MNLHGRDLEQGLAGHDVTELHEDLVELGFEVAQEELYESRFGEATLAAVCAFQVEWSVEITGKVDDESAKALHEARQQHTWVISGHVTSAGHATVGRLAVEIVDRNVGGDEPVASGSTNDAGSYRTRALLSPATLRRRHKTAPDLQARISSRATDGKEKFLAASMVAWNAAQAVTLNVVLPAGTTGLPSEYETLVAAVAAFYPGDLSKLQETPKQQDLTFLAAKTGWDARALAMAVLAGQLSETVTSRPTASATANGRDPKSNAAASAPVRLQPAFYYALLRAGAPASAPQLFQMSPASAAAIWTQAIDQGVISGELKSDIEAAKRDFQLLAADLVLNTPMAGSPALLDQVGKILTTAADQNRFAELLSQYAEDWSGFWTAVKTQFPKQVDRLQLLGSLNALTLNNAALANTLAQVATPQAGGAANLTKLVSAGLYEPAAWIKQINGAVPAGIPGDTPAQQASNYASFLAAQVKLAYPTAVLADQVAKGVVPVAGETNTAAAVSRFLLDNQAGFVIGAEPVDAYIARTKVAAPTPNALAQIKRIQRVYQLTTSDDAMAVLLNGKADSAYAITRYDQAGFTTAFSAQLGGDQAAAAIHARANQVYNSVLNLAVSYGVSLRSPSLPGSGIRGPKGGNNPNVSPSQAEATLQTLFGSLDYCSCADCSSLLSPAAYFVDLLHFLNPMQGAAPTPQSVLFGRRPDLQYLALSCANTNTALPYLDIVNETLEAYVAGNLSLAGFQGFNTSPDISSAELVAAPQNVNDAAYAALQAAWYPAPLPFNRPLELLRRQLQALNVSLPEAMTRLRSGDQIADNTTPLSYGWSDILLERLGISRDEYRLFTDTSVQLGDLYGLPNATALDVLQNKTNLQQLSTRTAVTYVDLVAILKTQFVNPGSALIERLQALGINFAAIAALKTASADDVAAFKAGLPAGIDYSQYGGTDAQAVVNWLTGPNYNVIMGLITIVTSAGSDDDCSGTNARLAYANPNSAASAVSSDDFIRLIRFIRLWRKLQPLLAIASDHAAIHATDALLAALYPPAPPTPEDGFQTCLRRGGFVVELLGRLGLDGRSLTWLLGCWAPLDSTGKKSLYASLFLTPAMLQEDRGSQAATISPPLAQGDQLITTIEGRAVGPYVVSAGDVTDPATAAKTVAAAIAQQINADVDLLPATSVFSGQKLNARFYARAQNAQVVITAGFNMLWSSNPAGALASAVANPTDQSGTVTATAAGQTFNVSIDTLSITYTAVAGDDVNAVARNLAAAINANTAPHPYSGLPLNSLLAASAQGALVRVVTAGAGAPFSLSCTGHFAGPGAYTAGRLAQTFADNGYGVYLSDPNQTLLAHEPVICAACGLTGVDFAEIVAALGYDAATTLTLDSVSAVFRYGWLAHTLGLSVQEFLTLRSFSGLDPFASLDLSNARPAEPPAIRFVKLVQSLGNAGLATSQALYLLWNQDPSGTLAPSADAVATLAQALRAAFTAVQAQFTVPDNPTGSTAQQLMALVYDPSDTAFFFSLLNQAFSVSTPFTYTSPQLPDSVATDSGSLLTYDAMAQTLSLRGLLTAAQVAAISNDDNTLQNPVNTLLGLWSTALNPFFAKYPELQPLYQANLGAVDATSLLSSILPTLVRLRKIEQALAQITAQVGSDATFASGLLQDLAVLHTAADPSQPAVVDLTAMELGGLTAVIGAAPSQTTGPLAYGTAPASAPFSWIAASPVSAGAVTGSWTGFITPPQTGTYNFAVVTDDNAAIGVTLVLDGKAVATAGANGVWTSQTPIKLTSGKLTSIALTVSSVTSVVALGWRNSPGLGWTLIPASALYPANAMTSLGATYNRFLKAISLATALSLTAKEMAWFATDPHIAPGWLNQLAVTPNQDQPSPNDAGLTTVLFALIDFARLKASLSPNDERLLGVLQNPSAVLATNAKSALLSLTGWSVPSLNALLARFFGDVSLGSLASVRNFARIFDAMNLVKASRVSAVTLLSAVTNAPSPAAMGALESALRASYPAKDWLGVIQPINDGMRGKQRDALVAWILQNLAAANPNTAITTADDLYDRFLIDPSTEPPVLTSRIRLALAAVQLFVEKAIRGLEKQVSPAAFAANRDEWTAMKRYRVWQANREVFLWPENWLDQTLRDDQSPIFQNTMNSLLQGDITDDAATSAYLDYLSGLSEVAKLEPCGIYYVPVSDNKAGVPSNEAAYVVARNFGAHRKYYFRQYQNGSWTPWTQVPIECEDMPITPIVWGGRLFLFWLKTQKDSSAAMQSAKGSGLSASSTDAVAASAAKQVNNASDANQYVSMQATLWWTEYYNGKWQSARSSDPTRPTTIGPFRPSGPYAFDAYRDQIRLIPASATATRMGFNLLPGKSLPGIPLILTISTPQELLDYYSYLRGFTTEVSAAGFLLLNTHSVPIRLEDLPIDDQPAFINLDVGAVSWRQLVASGVANPPHDLPTYSGGACLGNLTAVTMGNGQVGSSQIVDYQWLPRTVDVPPVLVDVRTAPFLYEDRLSVFYVTATPNQVTFPFTPIFRLPPGATQVVAGLQPAQFYPADNARLQNTVVLPTADPVSFKGVQVLLEGGRFTSVDVEVPPGPTEEVAK